MTDERIERIITHYNHAKEKHPFFASSMCHCGSLSPIDIAYWERAVYNTKRIIKGRPSAENVLNAEVAEIFEAWSKGQLTKARNEICDAIAVLLRMEDHLFYFWEKATNEGTKQ